MALTVQLTGLTAHAWQFLPAGFVFGFGGGLAIVPVFSIILAGVGDHEVGSASGLLNALQQLGGTIGVAVSGTLFFELAAPGRRSAAGHGGHRPLVAVLAADRALALGPALCVAASQCAEPRRDALTDL